jgi:CcmD family protein
MTNLFVAYTLAFIIIFIFIWLLISRQTRLEKKLDELKQRLKDVNR